jgi:predicted metal-dependent HD superfamily phosphohydrolase
MESDLIKKAKAYAEETFGDKHFEKLPYHNLDHTVQVVKAVKVIGEQSGLNEDEMESAILAAWFHDVGYLEGDKDHELIAAEKAKELLTAWGASFKKTLEIAEAIKATRMPQQPESLISKVLCDADLYHLSLEDFVETARKLRQEWSLMKGQELTDEQWLQSGLEFLKQHEYHTPYGRAALAKGKKNNIKKLKKLLNPEKAEKQYKDLEDEVIKLLAKL